MECCQYRKGMPLAQTIALLMSQYDIDVDSRNFCPECHIERPDDERVKNGLKCAFCAGYGERRE